MSEKKTNGDSKYTQAVTKATGTGAGTAVEVVEGEGFGVMEITAEKAQSIVKDQKWEFAPKVGALKVEQYYLLVIEGNGPTQELKDKNTEEIKMVPTWIVASPDGVFRMRLLGSHDLNAKLPKVIGETVMIYRHPDRRLNSGNMFTEYDICVAPRADGKRRDWTEQKMIDAVSVVQTPALAAGNHAPHEDLIA